MCVGRRGKAEGGMAWAVEPGRKRGGCGGGGMEKEGREEGLPCVAAIPVAGFPIKLRHGGSSGV